MTNREEMDQDGSSLSQGGPTTGMDAVQGSRALVEDEGPRPGHGFLGASNAFYTDDSQQDVQDPLSGLSTEGYALRQSILQTSQNISPTPSSKPNARLRKACDACSARKVKCDEEGPPCRACRSLDILCTFQRQSRRRGPPNRHAEPFKRQRMEPVASESAISSSPPRLSKLSRPTRRPTALSAESICPVEIVELLIDDYFTYIYPILPFPEERWFVESLRQRRDIVDRPFLALLAAMVGSLVAAYPRRPRKRLKALGKENLFSSSLDFIKRCEAVVHEARGVGYLHIGSLRAYDAATSYLLFNTCIHTYRMTEGDLYLSECFAIVRSFDNRRVESGFDTRTSTGVPEENVDIVEREMRRRVYWTVFVTVRSGRTYGASSAHINLNPPTPTKSHPPLPLEIDDIYLHPTHIDAQPASHVPILSGFNTNIRLYLTYEPLLALELLYANDYVVNLPRHQSTLMACLANVKDVFAQMPRDFSVWHDAPVAIPASAPPSHYHACESRAAGMSRAQIAGEIQKANIHASYLTSRSFFIEKYWSLTQAAAAAVAAGAAEGDDEEGESESDGAFITGRLRGGRHAAGLDIRAERESIATDLLAVLSAIRPVHMEPNAVSFIMKIRQIAGTLLPTDDGGEEGENAPGRWYLQEFLRILMGLEKSGTVGGVEEGEGEGEEEGLRRWADLRENQMAFARSGSHGGSGGGGV